MENSNDLTIMTVNFNTPFFIYTLNKSIRKNSPWFKGKLIVIDNSTIEKMPAVTNDELEIYHFDNKIYAPLDALPKSKYPQAGNYNSAHHAMTINWGIDNLVETKYLLLLDSDILFKEDILNHFNKFKNENAALMGYKRTTYKVPCIAPWCCFINVELMRENDIHFFDFDRILYVNDNLTHDTGASLYEDMLATGCKIIEIPDNSYYLHFKGGSVFNEKCKNWISANNKFWH